MDRMRLITTILENLECDRGRLKETEEELFLSEEAGRRTAGAWGG